MPSITYIEHGGREHRVEVPEGLSVMRGAVTTTSPVSTPIAAANAPVRLVTFMSMTLGSPKPARR
jgi:hypothetical protein